MVALAQGDGHALVELAVGIVHARLAGQPLDGRPPRARALRAIGSSFVTLETTGRLRGCVGTLEASRPLYVDVIRNAVRAMADPRLPPLVADEWAALDVSVSVLSPPALLEAVDRAELIACLRTGTDGLIITDGVRRATFLPAVWRKLPDPERFVSALLVKGGWPGEGWPEGAWSLRYTVTEFHSRAPRTPLPSGTMQA